MTPTWPEIPGVTTRGGRGSLPASPAVVCATLAQAVLTAGSATLPDVASRVVTLTSGERGRIEGLLAWLPVSRVAQWDPSTGHLLLLPGTGVQDLAVRFAAWVGSRPVPADAVDTVKRYASAIVSEASQADAPPPPGALPMTLEVPSPAPAIDAPDSPPPPIDRRVTDKIRSLLDALDTAFVERRSQTRAALLALLAGQHVLLLGPPGTAKSMLARGLSRCFATATYFEYLLSRFTHPDELFGPVSIPGLKDEDYRRLTEGFLPTASVAFLDEVFKANSAILNSLLTLVNERLFHHGRHRDPVPLLGIIGASNELPEAGAGLEALFDRFLVRLTVPPVGAREAFVAVATGAVQPLRIEPDDALTDADLDAIRAGAQQVSVPRDVEEALVALWRKANDAEWAVSDRRWRQAVHLLKVGAAADGRVALHSVDLMMLEPVLAPSPDRAAEVRDTIVSILRPRAVPQHDLRAQWTLLHGDRVAPSHDHPTLPAAEEGWEAHRTRRQTGLGRFLAHHHQAVEHLAADRRRIEGRAGDHLWLERLPTDLLSAHILAARDLARILEVAEGYRADLTDARSVAAGLLRALPEAPRRMYGQRPRCILEIDDGAVVAAVGNNGDRLPIPSRTTATDGSRIPRVRVPADGFLKWLAGQMSDLDLLQGVPAWASGPAREALQAVRGRLEGQVVPPPPRLPPP